MLDIKIAVCPYCGTQFFAFYEEDAIKKYKEHKCLTTLAEKEIMEILDRICGDDMNPKRDTYLSY